MKEAGLVSAGPEAWKPYTTHYRQQAIVDFKEKMATALKQEQTSTLVPLSQDHQAWLTSPALLNVFQFDYEQGNCRSGVNYTNTFTDCIEGIEGIEGAADRKETVDVLVKWAKGDVTDTRNPLLRALVLNHPVLAEKVKEASSYPYIELREFVAKLFESSDGQYVCVRHARRARPAPHGPSRSASLHARSMRWATRPTGWCMPRITAACLKALSCGSARRAAKRWAKSPS